MKGNPKPTISWTHCDLPNIVCGEQYLNVSNVQMVRANFNCTATNAVGVDSASTVVRKWTLFCTCSSVAREVILWHLSFGDQIQIIAAIKLMAAIPLDEEIQIMIIIIIMTTKCMNEMKAIYHFYKSQIQCRFMISLLLFKLKFCPDLCSMVMVVNKVSPN